MNIGVAAQEARAPLLSPESERGRTSVRERPVRADAWILELDQIDSVANIPVHAEKV
jgi:hypothetical protein